MQARPYHEGPSASSSVVASRPQVGPTNSALSHPQPKPAAGKDKGRAMVLRGQWTCRLLLRTGYDHAGAARRLVKSGNVLPWRSNHGAAEGLNWTPKESLRNPWRCFSHFMPWFFTSPCIPNWRSSFASRYAKESVDPSRRVNDHHTKRKGDLGVLKVQADLAAQGFTVLHPLTEHAPFDLVAYGSGKFYRVQVRYRSMCAGSIYLDFRSVWNDRKGTHYRTMDKNEVDRVAAYCPDTDRCYYVDPRVFGSRGVTLRFVEPGNRQRKNIKLATDFLRMSV